MLTTYSLIPYSYVQMHMNMKYRSYVLSCNTAESKRVQRGPVRVSCADLCLFCLNNIDCRTENTIIYRLHREDARQGRNRPGLWCMFLSSISTMSCSFLFIYLIEQWCACASPGLLLLLVSVCQAKSAFQALHLLWALTS